MARGINFPQSASTNNFKSHLRYDARTGDLLRADRVQDANGFVTRLVDITDNAVFVADLQNTLYGWINYSSQGPIKVLVPIDQDFPAKPDGEFKVGVEFDLLLAKASSNHDIKEAVREFNSTAQCVRDAVNELQTAYFEAPESEQGKLPVVRLNGTTPVRSSMGTNQKPNFVIESWVNRPPLMQQEGMAPENVNDAMRNTMRATPPATGAQRATPPKVKIATNNPDFVPRTLEDFG